MPIVPEEEPDFEPGIYHAEIRDCRLKTSKQGNAMFEVSWRPLGFNRGDITTDYISFSKKAAGITKAKLGALGFEVGANVEAADLLGKRAWIQVEHDEYGGRVSCKVAVAFDAGCRGGYWPDGDLPDEVAAWVVKPPATESTAAADDIPF